MMDLLESPRVRQLLNEAEEALALLESGRGGAADVRVVLDTIYRDLGKYVHGLTRQDKSDQVARTLAAAPLEVTHPVDPPESGWFTDEKAFDEAPFFTEGDLDDHTDIPEPDTLGGAPTAEPATVALGMSLEELEAAGDAIDPTHPPPWLNLLSSFLELLILPEDLLDSHAMPEEASKVQWASGELNGRLPELPTSVQLAVLGMLAARARNLQAHVDLDIGPRMALDRLRRYREVNDLPWMAGLLPGGSPERGTWSDDAIAFWNLIAPQDPR